MIKNADDLITQLTQKQLSSDKINAFFQTWMPSMPRDEINAACYMKDAFSVFKLEHKSFVAKIIFSKPNWHKYTYNLSSDEGAILAEINEVRGLDNLKSKKRITLANYLQMSFINLVCVSHNSYSAHSLSSYIDKALAKIELLFDNISPEHIQSSFSTPFLLAGKEIYLADILTTTFFREQMYPYSLHHHEKLVSILMKHKVNLHSTGFVQYLPNLLVSENTSTLSSLSENNSNLELTPHLTLSEYFTFLHKNNYSENDEFNIFLEKHFFEKNVPKSNAKTTKSDIKV